jgi:branched-chain amino acid transport system substrate-binding protein
VNHHQVTRRNMLKGTVGGAALLSTGWLATACGEIQRSTAQTGSTLKIGYVSPVTGPAAAFGESDDYVLNKVRSVLSGGISVGGKKYSVEIVARDSQSNPQKAGAVAAELINGVQVDMMLCTSTPETVNPVADACEAARVPCLSTVVPWEAWYFGRGATPTKPFSYTYHFFVGVAQFVSAYSALWSGPVANNKIAAVMWPNDPDGNAIRQGLGPELKKAGFTLVDPGAYENGTNDYSSQIAAFKKAKAEIFNTFPIPPDFATFWKQAHQQGFRPKIATVAKTGLFPSQIEALGPLGYGLTSGFWWSPKFPYSCTLTGQTAQQLADDYQDSTGRQWTQIVGSNMALFEAAVNALKNSSDPKNKEDVAAALGKNKLTTVVGPLDWTSGPVKNVSTEPLTIAQWRRSAPGSRFPVEAVLVDNTGFKDIPLGGTLEPLT